MSGIKVKKLRDATKKEYDQQFVPNPDYFGRERGEEI
jgi:hypothetical protein